ncbi:hypothetical protein DYY66_1676 [Candidatus Nitrosotalea sp. FS]|uniref:hypothetical protein n=1 Tax=Candidatus Nitrosotalea sp. FS TaxID=2341021 RepID=UPI00140BB0D2|nr:hypothetical protein [Candidatus Nitrosotalea sp. FS]NHH97175.1 hypothetical protein [Candidatus Nitrosotalea sp. FS]
MKTLHLFIISTTVLLVPVMMNNHALGGCLVGGDWPNAPCYDLPGHTIDKNTLREQWAPYYQYKGASWMEMMKTQMIDAIKNGTINYWSGYSDATGNVWTYYSLNDKVPFFIPPGAQNYTKPDPIPSPLQQFRAGTPLEDTQCKENFVLWLKSDNIPVCVNRQTFSSLLQRGFLLPDSYNQFALNEAKRFIRSSPTFEFDGMENTLKLSVSSVEESFPPITLILATFDSATPGYGNENRMEMPPHLTHHNMSIVISNTNQVSQAIIDKQWDELKQKFLKY